MPLWRHRDGFLKVIRVPDFNTSTVRKTMDVLLLLRIAAITAVGLVALAVRCHRAYEKLYPRQNE